MDAITHPCDEFNVNLAYDRWYKMPEYYPNDYKIWLFKRKLFFFLTSKEPKDWFDINNCRAPGTYFIDMDKPLIPSWISNHKPHTVAGNAHGYNGCNYLSMLRSKLIHNNKRGPRESQLCLALG